MFCVSGEIYYMMERAKVSVEELDSVLLDHVWVIYLVSAVNDMYSVFGGNMLLIAKK